VETYNNNTTPAAAVTAAPVRETRIIKQIGGAVHESEIKTT
jgi:hypothetical protein